MTTHSRILILDIDMSLVIILIDLEYKINLTNF